MAEKNPIKRSIIYLFCIQVYQFVVNNTIYAIMDNKAHFDNATLQLNEGDVGNQGNQVGHTRKSPPPKTTRIPNKIVTDFSVKAMYSYKVVGCQLLHVFVLKTLCF